MAGRRRSLRLVALAVVVALPLLGTSGDASAKAKSSGCHRAHTCKSGGGQADGGSGGTPASITVQVDPNPMIEIGPSFVGGVIQVETSPSFAGDPVTISSSQLDASCGTGTFFLDLQDGGTPSNPFTSQASITAILDNEGNVTVDVEGADCAPGSSIIEADLAVAPYDTALSTLDVEPPAVTTPGVYGYPTSSGTVTGGEVETGDTPASGESDIIAVFNVETDPVYAEQTAEISATQLEDRCVGGWSWSGLDGTTASSGGPNVPATAPIDNDGNASFGFVGTSCAAGPSVVTADVEAGTHPTYTTTFNVLPPQPTI
jgi:hypothetical protein